MQETQETWLRTLGQENPLEEEGASHSSIFFLLQYSCLENSRDRGACILGYSPRGRKKSDTTEWLSMHHLDAEGMTTEVGKTQEAEEAW